MAQTKKNSKAKAAKKGKPEIVPDFYKEFEVNGATVELSLYEKEKKADGVKLVIANAFVIYCKVVTMKDYAFLSYPSFKSGDDYVNQVFCFDKELNEEINDALTEYYFD